MSHRPSQLDRKVSKESDGHCSTHLTLSPRQKGSLSQRDWLVCILTHGVNSKESLGSSQRFKSIMNEEASSAGMEKDRGSSKCKEPSMSGKHEKKAIKLQTWPPLMEEEG